jgi:rhomboid domain-containing protein 1
MALPLATWAVFVLCVGIYAAQFFGFVPVAQFSISAERVLFAGEAWRMLSAAFLHGGVWHIAFNMMSLYSLGPSLEPLWGSLLFALMLGAITLLAGALYVALSAALWAATGDPSWLAVSAVGFSGVLFALAVLQSTYCADGERSVFGLVAVPARYYPWVLMAVIQVMLPGVSLLGHLAGILVGWALTRGARARLLPSLAWARRVEERGGLRCLTTAGRYAPTPMREPVTGATEGLLRTLLGLLGLVWAAVSPLLRCAGACLLAPCANHPCVRAVGDRATRAAAAVAACCAATHLRLTGARPAVVASGGVPVAGVSPDPAQPAPMPSGADGAALPAPTRRGGYAQLATAEPDEERGAVAEFGLAPGSDGVEEGRGGRDGPAPPPPPASVAAASDEAALRRARLAAAASARASADQARGARASPPLSASAV